ncbi:PepSY domain-containing protein [Rheinheimera pleomorphica]|uniref:PepSY domain-containing protein n=1 Tax=Rheinheimera pleomorphica TaxID=2703963 RepID=UPI001420EB78|nr:PepSY domain-containing protein [Rheinheimera pleomorphica]
MFSTRVLLLTAALLFGALSQASTQPEKKPLSREQAAALAQQYYPGKIVKVQSDRHNYRIRVVQPDGRVITVLVDGQSGRVKRDGN